MTAPVPYESRVRPLIAEAPFFTTDPSELTSEEALAQHRCLRFVEDTAAASADLAEAVRAMLKKYDAWEACMAEADAARAALARLDAAGGARGETKGGGA